MDLPGTLYPPPPPPPEMGYEIIDLVKESRSGDSISRQATLVRSFIAIHNTDTHHTVTFSKIAALVRVYHYSHRHWYTHTYHVRHFWELLGLLF